MDLSDPPIPTPGARKEKTPATVHADQTHRSKGSPTKWVRPIKPDLSKNSSKVRRLGRAPGSQDGARWALISVKKEAGVQPDLEFHGRGLRRNVDGNLVRVGGANR